MKNSKNKDKLIEIFEGILQCEEKDGPIIREFNGKTYHRFMDYFYIDRETTALTHEQVFTVCRARQRKPVITNKTSGNSAVKKAVRSHIEKGQYKNILEIGSGMGETLNYTSISGHYVLSDADPIVVESNVSQGKHCVHFDKQSALPYKDSFFDVALSVFVFHFKIYTFQIKELARCLTNDGYLLSNVYLIEEHERKELENKLKQESFIVYRTQDPHESCKNNEYWIISKSKETIDKQSKELARTLGV